MCGSTKNKFEMPSSFTILYVLLAVVALITVGLHALAPQEVTSAALSDFFMAPIRGFTDAVPVCLFVLVLGGFLGIVAETGALNAGISALIKALRGNELMLIPLLMVLFSLGGTTYGMCEETVPFYALLTPVMMAAGFDPMVAAATVLLGAGAGCLGSTVNPFAIGAAVDSLRGVGIECNQATLIGLGAVLWIVSTAISIVFVMSYAKRVHADKRATVLTARELERAEETYGGAVQAAAENPGATARQKAVLALFAFTFAVMVVGFIPWEDFGITFWSGWSSGLIGASIGKWYFDEASAWFFIMAFVIGVVGGLDEGKMVDAFIAGAADMVGVVLITALARGISVLMTATALDKFVLKHAAAALSGSLTTVFAPLSYLLYLPLSFLIPSTSGMASLTMPIMGPLTQSLGFSPEVMVQIAGAANGLVNLFAPTGAFIGGLALARIELVTWLKFSAKVVVVIGVVSVAILTAAIFIL